jgi:hypothetical protein
VGRTMLCGSSMAGRGPVRWMGGVAFVGVEVRTTVLEGVVGACRAMA